MDAFDTVREWQREWRNEGRLAGQTQFLLAALKARFGAVPPEVVVAILETVDSTRLRAWVDPAVTAGSLDEFRAAAGL